MHYSIDILKLYSHGSAKGWNEFIQKSITNQNINALTNVMRGLQMGMADIEKKKLNSEKINVFYCRLIASIEKAIRKIMKQKEPNPFDNPLTKEINKKAKIEKKKRDNDLEKFLRKRSY